MPTTEPTDRFNGFDGDYDRLIVALDEANARIEALLAGPSGGIDANAANHLRDRCADAEAELARYRAVVKAERLLRWYVDSDLVEAGDEFGQWDDEVREFVAALTEEDR